MLIDWRSALLMVLIAPLIPLSVLLLRRAVETRAAAFLAGLLGCWSLLNVPFIIGFAGAYDSFPWLTFAPFDTELWLGPLVWLYTQALVFRKLPRGWWWWLVPGLAQTTYYTACFVLIGDAQAKFAFANGFHGNWVAPFESALGPTLGVVCTVLSWRLIRRYRNWLARHHSSMRDFDLSSLRLFLLIMTLLVSLWMLTELWQLAFGSFDYGQTAIIYMSAGMAVVWLAMDALTAVNRSYPKMDAWPDPTPDASPDTPADLSATARSNKSITALHTLRERIRQAGWHREADLSISELARRLATNESSLSALINAGGTNNFNSLINGLRIEEVCHLLLDAGKSLGVMEIAMQTGFGSKATFNRTFREQVGMTPSEFRKRSDSSHIPDFLTQSGI